MRKEPSRVTVRFWTRGTVEGAVCGVGGVLQRKMKNVLDSVKCGPSEWGCRCAVGYMSPELTGGPAGDLGVVQLAHGWW